MVKPGLSSYQEEARLSGKGNHAGKRRRKVSQWVGLLAVETEIRSPIPHWDSMRGTGLGDPRGPFRLCSSKVMIKE